MRLSLFIALRYLFSRKQKSVINVISWISLTGIAVSAMALVVVLSVYNGIGEVTQSLFGVFDPELKVEPTKGKSMCLTSDVVQALAEVPGVADVTPVVEENAWLTHGDRQAIVTLRGVPANYGTVTGLDTMMLEGQFLLREGDEGVGGAVGETFVGGDSVEDIMSDMAGGGFFLVLGSLVYYDLGLHALDNMPIAVHVPRRSAAVGFTLDGAFNTRYAMAAGCFMVQQECDSRYVLADIEMVRALLDYPSDHCSFLALVLQRGADVEEVAAQVSDLVGRDFRVLDRMQQQPLYYKIYRSERLGVIMILALIVLICTLSLVASLSLLILDKRHDIATLRSMGMVTRQIRRLFFVEGLLVSVVGIVAGLLIGFVVCFLQQRFGLISMGTGFVVEAFPVCMHAADFLLTFILVGALSSVSVALTVRHAVRHQ